MIRNILDWIDTEMDEIDCTDGLSKKDLAKCFGLGLLEGTLDVCAFIGIAVYTQAIVNKIKK